MACADEEDKVWQPRGAPVHEAWRLEGEDIYETSSYLIPFFQPSVGWTRAVYAMPDASTVMHLPQEIHDGNRVDLKYHDLVAVINKQAGEGSIGLGMEGGEIFHMFHTACAVEIINEDYDEVDYQDANEAQGQRGRVRDVKHSDQGSQMIGWAVDEIPFPTATMLCRRETHTLNAMMNICCANPPSH